MQYHFRSNTSAAWCAFMVMAIVMVMMFLAVLTLCSWLILASAALSWKVYSVKLPVLVVGGEGAFGERCCSKHKSEAGINPRALQQQALGRCYETQRTRAATVCGRARTLSPLGWVLPDLCGFYVSYCGGRA